MSKTSIQTVTNILLKIVALSGILMLMAVSFAYAGSGGGGGGGGGSNPSGTGTTPRAQVGTHAVTTDRNLANSVANDLNSRPNSMCSGCSATVTSNRDGTVSVSVRQNDTGGNDNRSVGGRPGTPNPTPSNCTTQPNLQTIDIFFVPAGTQPAQLRSPAIPGRYSNSIISRVLANPNPYQNSMVARNELEAGVLYEPVVMLRNTGVCSQTNSSRRPGMQEHDHAETMNDRYGGPTSYRFNFINTAYAGGGSRPKKNDYPNFFRNQLPFGTNGSFPVRARIDMGQNTSYEWEQYVNAFGPVTNGQTVYLKLPAFTSAEVGTHRIEVVTDIRHSVDPGRACFAATTPASAGWGCAQETNETDNDRSEVFTTGIGSTSLRLAVDVSDVHVRTGSVVTEIPFVTINSGRATISSYNYRVTIGSSQYASGTRTTSLVPTSRETVRAAGVYTAPTARTSVPLTVCAQVATSTEVCDTARVIVDTPQCSDARDNDTDGTQDAGDASCYSDPLDPATYNPNDDNEGDMATTSPSVSIEFKPVVNPVRYNTGAALEYVINGPAPMTCVVTGGGTNSPITHTPPRTTGQITTAPVTSTQQYTLRCTASVGGSTLQFERTTTVDVLPQIQET